MKKEDEKMMIFVSTGKGVKFIKPKSKLKKFTFERYLYLLFNCNIKLVMEFMDDGTSIVNITKFTSLKEVILNKKITSDILNKLEKINIESWRRNYKHDKIVLDGEKWSIKLEYVDSTKKYRSGDNAYPKNFNLLEDLITYVEKSFW